MSAIIDEIWQEICDKDDRTSPAEYPDMCLISRAELAEYIGRAVGELSLTLPVVGTLFVARGGATARAVRGVEAGPDEHSDLVRATDVTNALVHAVASLIGATPSKSSGADHG